MNDDAQPLTVGEFRRTIEQLGRNLGQRIDDQSDRIGGLTTQVGITNGRVTTLERDAARVGQQVVNLEREVFKARTPSLPTPAEGDGKPLTRWDLTVAVGVVVAVVAVLAFLGKV